MNKVEEKILMLLDELSPEDSWLEHKGAPEAYTNKKTEFVKDVIGFLNCMDSYGRDKFILIGISDKLEIIGIKREMRDDEFFQTLAAKIYPRPEIKSGTVNYVTNGENIQIGYIYIPASGNEDVVYEVGVEKIGKDDQKGKTLYKGESYIRCGTRTEELHGPLRREVDKLKQNAYPMIYLTDGSGKATIPTYLDDIIKKLALIGRWDDSNENDRQLISTLLNMPYETVLESLQPLLDKPDTILKFKNGQWHVIDRFELVKKYAPKYFKHDIEKMKIITTIVLSEGLNLGSLPNNDDLYALAKKELIYSHTLKKGIAELMPILTATSEKFTKCQQDIASFPYQVIRGLLNSNKKDTLVVLSPILLFLAEAAPNIFLSFIEEELLKPHNMIETYMQQLDVHLSLFDKESRHDLYGALLLIAWNPKMLTRVCGILTELSSYDTLAKEYISTLLSPLAPKKASTVQQRKTAITNVLRENNQFGWDVLKMLVSRNNPIARRGEHVPKWNNVPTEREINPQLTNELYWEQVQNYIELLIIYAGDDQVRICDLVDLLDKVPEKMFKNILKKISDQSIQNLPENQKYIIWNQLENLINQHLKYIDKDVGLSKNNVSKLQAISEKVKPKSELIYGQRYFLAYGWNKLNMVDEELFALRISIIKSILTAGFDQLIVFVNTVDDPYMVGRCTTYLEEDTYAEEHVLSLLESTNEKEILFARGFSSEQFYKNGYTWLTEFDTSAWSTTKKTNLLIDLPNKQKTWDVVLDLLDSKDIEYWRKVNIQFIEEESSINYPVGKLLEAGRPEDAIFLLAYSLQDAGSGEYDKQLGIKALKLMASENRKDHKIDYYWARELIKDLQNSDVSKEDMLQIEWSYLGILSDPFSEETKPMTIYREMANDPRFFNEVLCLVYSNQRDGKDTKPDIPERVSWNAFALIRSWKICPGLTDDGYIDKNKLNTWYEEVKRTAEEGGILETALVQFGQVLYYAPADKTGLWIDRNVAELLNKNDTNSALIRQGFKIEAHNSKSFFSGKIEDFPVVAETKAKYYDDRAEEIEEAGYFRIASAMREVADWHRWDGENHRPLSISNTSE